MVWFVTWRTCTNAAMASDVHWKRSAAFQKVSVVMRLGSQNPHNICVLCCAVSSNWREDNSVHAHPVWAIHALTHAQKACNQRRETRDLMSEERVRLLINLHAISAHQRTLTFSRVGFLGHYITLTISENHLIIIKTRVVKILIVIGCFLRQHKSKVLLVAITHMTKISSKIYSWKCATCLHIGFRQNCTDSCTPNWNEDVDVNGDLRVSSFNRKWTHFTLSQCDLNNSPSTHSSMEDV